MNDNFNNGRIFCTKCGAPNKAGYRFCVRCGAKLMVLDPKPEPEISNELPQTEPVRSEPVTFEPEPAAHEPEPIAFESEPKTEKFDTAAQTFGVFEEPTQQEEPVAFEPEPITFEPEPEEAPQTFTVFDEPAQQEEPAPQEEPAAFEPEPITFEPEPEEAPQTFGVFEEPAQPDEPVAIEPEPAVFESEPAETEPAVFESEPVETEPAVFETEPVESEPAPQTFGVFEEPAPQEEPVKAAGFARHGEGAFEKEPDRPDNGFARSGFTGATTPTAAAGAFATAVDAVKNNKQIDVSDAETVMSLLEQGESSALAQGLPDWDIVPPQVVVRRKRRV